LCDPRAITSSSGLQLLFVVSLSNHERAATQRVADTIAKSTGDRTLTDTADILLCTVNEHENRETQAAFGRSAPPAVTKGRYRYWDYGVIGGARVVHAQCEMGDLPGGKVVRAAIDSWNPSLVIAVGIAWGALDTEHAIGDILLASPLVDAAHRAVKPDGIRPRGKQFPQTDSILQITKSCYTDWNNLHGGSAAPLHVGEILSLPTLLDNEDERTRMLKAYPKAIGGEMEGRGIVDAATEQKRDWLLLKAICDWGMKKNVNDAQKEIDQRLAAKNAAAFLRFAVENGLAHLTVQQLASRARSTTSPSSNSVTMTIGTVSGGTVIGNAGRVNIGVHDDGSKKS